YSLDSATGRPRRVAGSFVPSRLSEASGSRLHDRGRPPPLLESPALAGFLRATRQRPWLHQGPTATNAHRAADRRRPAIPPEVQGLHLVAVRIEAGTEIWGLMVFALDHAPRPAERRALEDFVAEASRVTESRLAGRSESSVQA